MTPRLVLVVDDLAAVSLGSTNARPPPPDKEKGTIRKTVTTPAALLLVAAIVGCDGAASSADPPTGNHVFEDLLAALDIEGPTPPCPPPEENEG